MINSVECSVNMLSIRAGTKSTRKMVGKYAATKQATTPSKKHFSGPDLDGCHWYLILWIFDLSKTHGCIMRMYYMSTSYNFGNITAWAHHESCCSIWVQMVSNQQRAPFLTHQYMISLSVFWWAVRLNWQKYCEKPGLEWIQFCSGTQRSIALPILLRNERETKQTTPLDKLCCCCCTHIYFGVELCFLELMKFCVTFTAHTAHLVFIINLSKV